jgi:hypothetical protein
MPSFEVDVIKMEKPRRQHYIPQSYLNRFAATKGQLVVFDFFNERKFVTSPQNVAHIRDFYYADVNDAANANIVESYFSKIEGPAKCIIDEFVKTMKPPNKKDWNVLSEFIAGMYVRIPHFRFQYLEIAESFLRVLGKKARANQKFNESLQSSKTTKPPEDLSDYGVAIHQNEYVLTMLKLIPNITTVISQMTPSLLISYGTSKFITSDNPVILFDPKPKPYLGSGWLTETIEVYFPLSPLTCLVLRQKGNYEVLPADNKCVAMLNTHLITFATQYLFSSDIVSWISENVTLNNETLLFKEFAEVKKSRNFIQVSGLDPSPKKVAMDRIKKSTYTELQNSKNMPSNK